MTTNWTPGPWRIIKPNDDDANFCQKRPHIASGLTTVAYLTAVNGNRQQMFGNAYLIAAAPELYEVMAEIVDNVSLEWRWPSCGPATPRWNLPGPLMRKVIEALAKARGDEL